MVRLNLDDIYDAIYDGDCEKIDAIIKSGLDVNAQAGVEAWNLLHMALVSITIPPKPDVVRHLICLGVDVNARDRHLWTPLHFAVRTKNSEVVQLLIEAGAEINAANDEGITPFHLCLLEFSCNLEIVEMLLVGGANPDIDLGRGTVRNYVKVLSNPSSDQIRELLMKYTNK